MKFVRHIAGVISLDHRRTDHTRILELKRNLHNTCKNC